MTAATDPGHAPGPARRRNLSKPVIGVLTTSLALWLGLTAPTTSPVAPATAATAATGPVPPTTVEPDVDPVDPALVAGGRSARSDRGQGQGQGQGPGGRGRR